MLTTTKKLQDIICKVSKSDALPIELSSQYFCDPTRNRTWIPSLEDLCNILYTMRPFEHPRGIEPRIQEYKSSVLPVSTMDAYILNISNNSCDPNRTRICILSLGNLHPIQLNDGTIFYRRSYI